MEVMTKFKVAIVEDDKRQYQVVFDLLKEFAKGEDIEFLPVYFPDGVDFLNQFDGSFDLIFMDIEMPRLDGLSVSSKLRLIDSNVPIIIISHSAKYAVRGYYVQAFGYLVKPISKTDFDFLLKKAINEINRKKNSFLLLESKSGIQKVHTKDILYIEVVNHYLSFYLADGTSLRKRGKMTDYADRLEKAGFSRCNECYLVNLAFVTKIDATKNLVYVKNNALSISRLKKKNFIEAFTNFLGENAQNV